MTYAMRLLWDNYCLLHKLHKSILNHTVLWKIDYIKSYSTYNLQQLHTARKSWQRLQLSYFIVIQISLKQDFSSKTKIT